MSDDRPASLLVLGCGDAFGSGGRMHTSFLVDTDIRFLIDCGASALIAMKRHDIDPESIDTIVLTHLHGDHFGGIPFLVRETQIAAARTRPLTIIGPPGHEARVQAATDLLFPGAAGRTSFELVFREYTADAPVTAGGLTVRAFPAVHTPGTNPHAVRVERGGLVVAYSGDTEWVDDLLVAADGADLFICECYRMTPVRNHLDYETLMRYRDRLRCRRILLTHMGPDMLAAENPEMPARAYDGLVVEL
jgi:ribonuclease BN (tRNA processing enzyme)